MPAPPAATFCRWLADARAYVSLTLQPFQRRVDGADRNLSPRALLDLASDRGAVRIGTEPYERHEDELLEFAKGTHAAISSTLWTIFTSRKGGSECAPRHPELPSVSI